MLKKEKVVKQNISPMKLHIDKYDIDKFELYVESNKIKIYEHLVDIIFDVINSDLKQIDAFEFKNSNDILIFKKSNWKSFLETVLPIFLKEEKYEYCDKIKKIKLIIESPPKKRGRKPKEKLK